jgi:hypothetical protein
VQRIPQDLNARNYDGKGLYFLSWDLGHFH